MGDIITFDFWFYDWWLWALFTYLINFKFSRVLGKWGIIKCSGIYLLLYFIYKFVISWWDVTITTVGRWLKIKTSRFKSTNITSYLKKSNQRTYFCLMSLFQNFWSRNCRHHGLTINNSWNTRKSRRCFKRSLHTS